MGCLIVLLSVMMPRMMMFFILILTDWFSRAYETTIWPILGWIFMPFTTLAYMAAMLNNNHQISGGWMFLMFFAILCDLCGNFSIKIEKS